MEQFYVSISPGRQAATVSTDNKSDLLDAVRRSDERLSAVELLSAEMLADRRRSVKDPALREEHTRESVIPQQFIQEWNHVR
jgi:hypothetical protein